MSSLPATIVDTKDLWQTVVASAIAGVGVTASFSLMILGAARFAELRRDERPLPAAAAAAVAGLGVAISLGGIAFGLVVMLSK